MVKALDKMGAYLRTLTAFEVESTNSTDEVLDTGQKVQFDGTARLQVRRPDKLHAEVKTDRKHREFFYDGKTFTLFGRRVNYYATVPAPPTLRELVIELAERYGIEPPLADLFFWGSEDDRHSDLRSAIDLGPSTIGGTECEQYALREEGVDWQIWIQKGDTPLAAKTGHYDHQRPRPAPICQRPELEPHAQAGRCHLQLLSAARGHEDRAPNRRRQSRSAIQMTRVMI